MSARAVSRLVTTSAAAALLAVSASAAFAATGDPITDDLKRAACGEVGCTNGSRMCGSVIATWFDFYWVLDHEIALENHAAWSCYERPLY